VVLLQLATQTPCGALSEGEKLTHELQLIEQGIREKEKELRLVCNIMISKEVQDWALIWRYVWKMVNTFPHNGCVV
jgi:hypothetical protein